MILAALVLLLVGAADLLRVARLRRAVEVVAIAVTWVVILVVAVTGLGLPVLWALATAVPALLWLWTTSARADVRRASGVLPGIGLLIVVGVVLLVGPALFVPSGYLVDWHATAPVAVRRVPLDTLVLALGGVVFLVESANILVRAALRPAVEESDAVDASVAAAAAAASTAAVASGAGVRRRWWSRPSVVPVAAPVADLKGGRLIGPLERLLIVALTLAGALPIVAGILAAKGIVRFPEISTDGARGSKAEYFLVGSLVSWSIALVVAGALWISAQG